MKFRRKPRPHFPWMLIFLLLPIVSLAETELESPSQYRLPNRLCIVLENLQPGDRLPVILEGELSQWFTFVDPREVICRREAAPGTKAELAAFAEIPAELKKLHEKDGRALVRVAGEIYGPERGAAPDLESNIIADYSKRYSKRHHGIYWSKLVIHEFLNVQAATDRPLWDVSGFDNTPFPNVVKADLPTHYPPMAWGVDLSGEVRVQLTIENGTIMATEVISGDRLLIDDTLANIKTWQFEPGATARFTTTFVYKLEPLPADATPLAVRADLPLRVEIVAPLDTR